MTDNHKTWLAVLIIASLSALMVAAGIGLSTAARAAATVPGVVTSSALSDGYWLFAAGVIFTFIFGDHKGGYILGVIITVAGLLLVLVGHAKADESWWQRPAIRACCSDADALYADDWRVNPDGSITAMVTGGGPRNHAWAPVGRVYEIPADKVRSNEGNPIGRPLIFVNPHNNDIVFCFVPGVMI